MPIAYSCPHCGKQYSVADQYAGQTGPCANCGQPITTMLICSLTLGAAGRAGLSRRPPRVVAAGAGRLVGLAGSSEPATRTRPRRPRPPKPGMDDTTLTRKVESEIFRIRGVAKGKIDVNAAGGVVWVRGEGGTPALIKRIETKAASIPEVKRVENLLHLPKTPAPSRTASFVAQIRTCLP